MSNILSTIVQQVSNFRSVASLFSSSLSVDVVRIVDTEGKQMFMDARAMKAGVNPDSTIFEHPLETGNKVADFKIMKPIVAQLGLMIPTDSVTNVYAEIKQCWEQGTELTLQTRAGTYTNLIIQSLPHEESGEYGDTLAMSLTLREVQWYTGTIETLPAKSVSGSTGAVNKGAKSNADTVAQGQKRATDASDSSNKKKESILHGWFG